MNPIALKFLEEQQVGVLSGLLPDGSPHSSTVHFSHTENPIRLYFQTSDRTTKAASLLTGASPKASVVLGFDEKDKRTLQMRGEVRLVLDRKELEQLYLIHHKKHPSAAKHVSDHTVMIEFTPSWWRYTDFTTVPETIISG